MMPTLRDRIRHQQWRQETETATLSLAEIAERWARLECGEGFTEPVINDYLREIASQLRQSQQLRKRLERAVMPTSPASVPQIGVVDPWQALNKMRNELLAAAAGDREAAAKLRFTDSMLRTYLGGSASQPPAGLFPVPPPPQPQGAQAGANGTDESLVLEGAESQSERAYPDPSSPNVVTLGTTSERASTCQTEAQPAKPACTVENPKTAQHDDTDYETEAPSEDAPGRREQQVNIILETARNLGYTLLAIPYGGKAKIKKKCMQHKVLFTESAFDHAWKKARSLNLVAVVNTQRYAKR